MEALSKGLSLALSHTHQARQAMSAPASNDNQAEEPPPVRTLGYHYEIARALFGDDSPGVKLLKSKIDAAPQGEAAICYVPESQVVYMMIAMHLQQEEAKGQAE
jgi:hypothetical protein